MDISKNHQSREDLERIVRRTLNQEVLEAEELTIGQCNALYKLALSDGSRVVLKMAAQGGSGLRRGERWLMKSEIEAMRAIEEVKDVPTPRVLFADDSCTVCNAPYFIMECMPGICLGTVCRQWTGEEKAFWYKKIGQIVARIATVKHPAFGIVASGEEFADFFAFIRWMLTMLLEDARDLGVDLGVERERILFRLEESRPAFREVTEPCLVHYDIWENNLMGERGRITGVIDWERAIWAEPLMEERFRAYAVNRALCEGYGKLEFTLAETERMLWYDMLMDAALMVDVFFRQYADDAQYHRARGRFEAAFAKLSQPLEVFVPPVS